MAIYQGTKLVAGSSAGAGGDVTNPTPPSNGQFLTTINNKKELTITKLTNIFNTEGNGYEYGATQLNSLGVSEPDLSAQSFINFNVSDPTAKNNASVIIYSGNSESEGYNKLQLIGAPGTYNAGGIQPVFFYTENGLTGRVLVSQSYNINTINNTSSFITGGVTYIANLTSAKEIKLVSRSEIGDSVQNISCGFFPGETSIINTKGAYELTFSKFSSGAGSIYYNDGYSDITPTASDIVSYSILYDGQDFLINRSLYKSA